LSIASKEADETDYWLNLLHDNGYLGDSQFDSLNADCQRLNKILTSIIKKVKLKFNTK
jgi:four helix bundle protein